jgi:hypothetical protein
LTDDFAQGAKSLFENTINRNSSPTTEKAVSRVMMSEGGEKPLSTAL